MIARPCDRMWPPCKPLGADRTGRVRFAKYASAATSPEQPFSAACALFGDAGHIARQSGEHSGALLQEVSLADQRLQLNLRHCVEALAAPSHSQ